MKSTTEKEPMTLQEFIASAPGCLQGEFDNATDIASAKMYALYAMDAFTDEPISEREHGAIKTKRQYEQVKKWFGGHPQ